MIGPKALKLATATLFVCLVLALGFFLFAPRSKTESLVAVGTIEALIGEADRRLPQTLDFKPASPGDSLHSGELVVTKHASEVTLKFQSGAIVRLGPGVRFVAEVDATRRDGAIIATLIEGDAQVLAGGTPNSLRIFKDGRELSLNERTAAERPVIHDSSASMPAPDRKQAVIITPTKPSEPPTPQPRKNSGAIGGESVAAGESLTNDEIRRSLRSNSGFFQRCYLNYLNRVKPEASDRAASVTVGFVIANTGKVREAKIVRTDFNDATLNNCILETVERTSFRAFRGTDIPVLEFPVELR